MKHKQEVYMFFRYFLFFMSLSYTTLACVSLPDQIQLSGSSFIEEKIIIGTAPSPYMYKHKISLGSTALWHNGKCWMLEDNETQKGCLNQFRKGSVPLTTESGDKTIGQLEFTDDTGKLVIYSVDPYDEKANAWRPYLVFDDNLLSSQNNQAKSELIIQAYDKLQMVGKYKSEKRNYSRVKGGALSFQKVNNFEMRGQSGVSSRCHGIEAKNFQRQPAHQSSGS